MLTVLYGIQSVAFLSLPRRVNNIYVFGVKIYFMTNRNYETTTDGKFRGVIYKRTLNSPGNDSGKAYIGKTTNEKTRQRMWSNANNASYGGRKITEARKNYGPACWDYEVLEEVVCDDASQLDSTLSEKEQFWIKEHDTVEKGFNGSYGDGNLGRTFKWQNTAKHRDYQTEETRQKISRSLKGHKVSDETKQKISSGNNGKKRTQEQKDAQSSRMKGTVPHAAKEGAERWREANGGSFWKGKKMPDAARAKMKINARKKAIPVTAIFSDGTTKTYDTMLDAATDNDIGVGSVYNGIKNNGTTKQGIKFKRA